MSWDRSLQYFIPRLKAGCWTIRKKGGEVKSIFLCSNVDKGVLHILACGSSRTRTAPYAEARVRNHRSWISVLDYIHRRRQRMSQRVANSHSYYLFVVITLFLLSSVLG